MYPIKQKAEADARITFRMTQKDIKEIKSICAKHNWVVSDYIRHALIDYKDKCVSYDSRQPNLPFAS